MTLAKIIQEKRTQSIEMHQRELKVLREIDKVEE